MIYYLKGILQYIRENYIIIEVNGIGFKIYVSTLTINCLPNVGLETNIFTYFYIKEDIKTIYGFYSEDELELFELILSVSGIGPKSSLATLSTFTPNQFKKIIIEEDIKLLTAVSGIGLKSAKRIVFELKDKINSLEIDYSCNDLSNNNFNEAVDALVALGYTQEESNLLIKRLDVNYNEKSVQELIRLALTKVNKR